jgi:maleylpyruvate isomerase
MPQPVPGGEAVSDWMAGGEEFFRRQVARADDLTAPSLLPGWSRAHVVAHLVGNSDAFVNLLHWARTGIETPMYASEEARRADLDRRVALPAGELLAELDTALDRLAAAFANLPAAAWDAHVRTRQGQVLPVTGLPWMRGRETWIHGVDLGAGAWFDALPDPLVDALLTELTGTLSGREGCPAVTVVPSDRDRTWALGTGSTQTVRGTAADILGWLLGRPSTVDGPTLPRWL